MTTTPTPATDAAEIEALAKLPIRELDWDETWIARGDGGCEVTGWEARDSYGEFYTIEITMEGFVVTHKALINDPVAESEEAAKALAQDDFAGRIRWGIDAAALRSLSRPVEVTDAMVERDEREALVEVLLPHIDDEQGFLLPDEHRKRASAAADDILAAVYRLPTTGELAAERRGWEAAADALDHWGDQEDAAAVTGPEADVTVHRAREAAFYDAAARLRAAPRASDQGPPRAARRPRRPR